MVYLLSAFGHEPLEAHEGSEGLQRAKTERPDLILLDIHMPQMDGYEVVRRLRADPACAQVPVVAVTALAMVGDREKILASGFNGYIAKPIEAEVFLSQVNGFVASPPKFSSPAAAQAPAAPPREQEHPARPALVLLVDNSPTNIDLLRSVLEPSGYRVVTALCARDGIELARRRKPDLIVSDIHMPDQDGFEFMRLAKADPEISGIPFVFLSSSVRSRPEQQRAVQQGARKFISRPIDPERLLFEVQEALERTEN